MTGRDVFVYFNNDGDANAVRNALALRALLGWQARLGGRRDARRRIGGGLADGGIDGDLALQAR